MSFTRIETVTSSHYVLPMKHSASSYLQAMSVSSLFSDEEHELIQDLNANMTAIGTPFALALFLSDILYPAIDKQQDEALLEQMLQIEDSVKNFLAEALPKGSDIEAFLKETRTQIDQDKEALHNKRIEVLFEEKITLLYKLADDMLAKMDQGHELLKTKILTIIQLHEKMAAESASQAERIEQLTQELLAISTEFQHLGDKSQENYKTYQQLLGKCHELCKQI